MKRRAKKRARETGWSSSGTASNGLELILLNEALMPSYTLPRSILLHCCSWTYI